MRLRAGVTLADLLIIRPAAPIEGLEIAADLVRHYSAALLVFGSTTAHLDDAGKTALRRLVNAVRRSSCAVIVLNRAPSADASPFHAYAATRIELRRVRWLQRWGTVGGYLVRDHGAEKERR